MSRAETGTVKLTTTNEMTTLSGETTSKLVRIINSCRGVIGRDDAVLLYESLVEECPGIAEQHGFSVTLALPGYPIVRIYAPNGLSTHQILKAECVSGAPFVAERFKPYVPKTQVRR